MGDSSDAADEAVWALARAFPEFSAHIRITRPQVVALLAVGAVILSGLCLTPRLAIVGLAAMLACGFVANVVFRCCLMWIGAVDTQDPGSMRRLDDEELPIYSLLVPVYREANILPSLIASLQALDYPKSRLDVLIVAEADDAATVTAATRLATEAGFTIVSVPACLPRTKPKACNFALPFARGDYLVIYDAEDRPEPDQLRKAVAAFLAAPPSLACLQARLSFYNATESWISAMFTLDYELWFGFLLPGLAKLGVPMPLGGTSNHFRTSVLREIKGWDSFNVTEDADIGIRLAQRGYGVATLESTTFEEATTTIDNWTRQRSRWMKGYIQTWLVHMRNPAALVQSAGIRGFVTFQLFVGGAFFAALVNPLLWLMYLATRLLGFGIAADAMIEPLGAIALASLIGGNAIFTYLMMLAALRRDWLHLVPYGITSCAYWLMISLAAWRGLWQLLWRPFFWEKTDHGISRAAALL